MEHQFLGARGLLEASLCRHPAWSGAFQLCFWSIQLTTPVEGLAVLALSLLAGSKLRRCLTQMASVCAASGIRPSPVLRVFPPAGPWMLRPCLPKARHTWHHTGGQSWQFQRNGSHHLLKQRSAPAPPCRPWQLGWTVAPPTPVQEIDQWMHPPAKLIRTALQSWWIWKLLGWPFVLAEVISKLW